VRDSGCALPGLRRSAEAPELRIVPQELWDAAMVRQDALTALYQKQIDSSRAATRAIMRKMAD